MGDGFQKVRKLPLNFYLLRWLWLNYIQGSASRASLEPYDEIRLSFSLFYAPRSVGTLRANDINIIDPTSVRVHGMALLFIKTSKKGKFNQCGFPFAKWYCVSSFPDPGYAGS